MQEIIYDSWRAGMSETVSPRNLGRYVDQGGRYGGPFPRLVNVDRRGGTLRPRGGEAVVNTSNPTGVIKALHALEAIYGRTLADSSSDPVYDADESILCVDADGKIGRVPIISGDSRPHQRLGIFTYTWSNPSCLSLGRHVLVYWKSSGRAAFVDWFNDDMSGVWKVTNGSGILYCKGSGATPWEKANVGWIGKYITVKDGAGNTYGPYRIVDVSLAYAGQTTDGTRVDIDSGYGGPSGTIAAENTLILGTRAGILPVPAAPQVAEGPAGNLSGTYQYACTYRTHDGFESDHSAWSAEITVSDKKILVWDLDVMQPYTYAKLLPVGEQVAANIDGINIYRRGGTHADLEELVSTFYLPYRDDGEWAGVNENPLGIADADMTLHTNDLDNWGTIDASNPVVFRFGTAATGYECAYSETKVAGPPPRLTGCVRGYGYTNAAEQPEDTSVFKCSYLDNLADSSVTGKTLRHDRGYSRTDVMSGYAPLEATKLAGMTGDRLWVVNRSESYRLYFSGLGRYRDFADPDVDQPDYDDPNYSWYVDVGGHDPITALLPVQEGVIAVFKERECYLVSGRSAWNIRVEKIESLPGADNQDTVLMHDNRLFWTNQRRVFLWDLGGVLQEISLPVADTLRNSAGDFRCALAYDDCVYLFFQSVITPTTKTSCICWDFRYQWPLADTERYAPTPVLYDEMTVFRACVGYKYDPKGIVYACFDITGGNDKLGGILGTWTKWAYPSTLGGNLAAMEVQLPDLAIKGGTMDTLMDSYWIHAFSEDKTPAIPATDLSVYPRLDSRNGSAIAETIPAVVASDCFHTIYRHVNAANRATHVGLKIGSLLTEMADATADGKREIERIVLGLTDHRRIRR